MKSKVLSFILATFTMLGACYFFHIIRAKKKDFLPLINMAKKQLKEAKRLLKIYGEIEFLGDNS